MLVGEAPYNAVHAYSSLGPIRWDRAKHLFKTHALAGVSCEGTDRGDNLTLLMDDAIYGGVLC